MTIEIIDVDRFNIGNDLYVLLCHSARVWSTMYSISTESHFYHPKVFTDFLAAYSALDLAP